MPVYYKHGHQEKWDYTPGEDVTAETAVKLGEDDDVIGVIVADTLANTRGAVAVSGVYDFPTDLTAAEQGDAAYLASNGKITATTTDTYAGRVVKQGTGRIWVSINMMWAPAGS
jgi:predicted RecA/RadA family phage recombinase